MQDINTILTQIKTMQQDIAQLKALVAQPKPQADNGEALGGLAVSL